MSSGPRWTSEQESVLLSSGAGMAVTAGAGAGKTTTLVEKCVRLLSSQPEARLCAVSFTEKSASDLRAKLARALREHPGFDLSRHSITTIHGLCGSILREFPKEAGYRGDERVLSELEASRLWTRALEMLWNRGSEGSQSLQQILAREGRAGTEGLLARFRELEAAGTVEQALQSEQPDLQAAAQVASEVLAYYDRLKRRSAGIDFADLEKAALQALESPAVRRALQARFALVLVDEFQDTNPVQARILEQVVRPDRSNLCVVGDPKQSIYRFRDADVRLFEQSCSTLPVRRSLTWNFRSHPGVLDAVNRLCEPLFTASQLAYEPLVAGRTSDEFSLQPDEPPVARLNVESPEGLADWICRERDRGVALDSMAILMRRVRGMEPWIQALSRRGIPVAVGGGGLFWQDPRVLELLALIRWWAFPVDEWAAAAFLRAPWVNIPSKELDRWKREQGNFEAFWSSEHPIAVALASCHSKLIRPGELLSMLLSSGLGDEAEQELGQSLLSLWVRCERLSLEGCDFQEVVRRLNDAVEKGRREKEVPPPANRGVLPILTVHASKGLEFDRVFLVDFGRKSRSSSIPMLFVDRERGVFLVPRGEDGKKDDRNPSYREWRDFEQKALVAESKRLFYVALTRARSQLVFVCEAVDSEKGFEQEREKALGLDHWRGWLEHLGREIPFLESETGVPEKVSPAEKNAAVLESRRSVPFPGWIRSRHSVSEWTVLGRCPRAYARLIRDRWSGRDVPEDSREDPFDSQVHSSGLSTRELGKRVHAVLERWVIGARSGKPRSLTALEALEAEAGSARLRAELLAEWWDGQASVVQSWPELPFECRIEPVSLVGVIDRVDQLGEGRYRIVDYKVVSRPKSDDEILDLYAPQLRLYAWALKHLLRAELQEVSAVLVQISASGIVETTVAIEIAALDEEVTRWAKEAERIVSLVGEQGMSFSINDSVAARPAHYCRHCPHLADCDSPLRDSK